MACLALSTGRALACKNVMGGIKAVYFADYGTLGDLTITDGEITAFGGTPAFFEYDVKGSSGLEQTINASRENGTVFYEQTLTLVLTKLDLLTQNELIKVIDARPYAVIEDYNNNYLLIGADNGADCNGGSITTGVAAGDLTGFSITMAGQEKLPAFFVTPSVLQGAVSASFASPTQIVP
tara:strand:- start:2607 stop:3146 length:540 start_codon:yes stop_codon:yes gene_type:complete